MAEIRIVAPWVELDPRNKSHTPSRILVWTHRSRMVYRVQDGLIEEKTMSSKDYVKTEEALSRLTDQQRYVTQEEGTERAYDNEYWANDEPGIYVDVVSGQPLFSSIDKYDSGTGWPSFTKPIDDDAVDTRTDHQLSTSRIEVRSAGADSHLGHLFSDGPQDSTGLRYCMNSAALRLVPASSLEEEGYGQYRSLFDPNEEETGDRA